MEYPAGHVTFYKDSKAITGHMHRAIKAPHHIPNEKFYIMYMLNESRVCITRHMYGKAVWWIHRTE